MDENIRTIEVEFLRPGPPHNQLLSPLTQYLAVCGEAGAGTVTIPFEQAAFNRRLSNLRYEMDDEAEGSARVEALRMTGNDLGRVLDAVPGLLGSLAESSAEHGVINLRIVTSASELALLPFELAKVPSGTGRPSDEWLTLRTGTPICMTRRVRSVVPSSAKWPQGRPRILFVVGLGIEETLVAQHREVLQNALAPWTTSDYNPLVELRPASTKSTEAEKTDDEPARTGDATIVNIIDCLAAGVTGVHILAHGAMVGYEEAERYGILLQGEGRSEGDVITGERFASALRSLPHDATRPAAIVVASCDSGYQADILVPGGSFARALHMAGVPLVVASQYPLTYEGSVRLTEMTYEKVLWGANPLPTLARARAALHAEFGHTHDWASLVVYDALPKQLGHQLEEVRYNRARNAVDDALADYDKNKDKISKEEAKAWFKRARAAADLAIEHFPSAPQYAMEVGGLRASYAKRLAKYMYDEEDFIGTRDQLEIAHREYRTAAAHFYRNRGQQLRATLHWLETQSLSLDRIMGERPQPGAWEIAFRSTQMEAEGADAEGQAWSHSSLAELHLLRVFDETIDAEQRAEAKSEARSRVLRLLEIYHSMSDFPILSTHRQLERYATWWGDEKFAERLRIPEGNRSPRWPEVRDLAQEMVELIEARAMASGGGD